MPTELTWFTELSWFIVGMAFGLGFLLSLSVGYFIGKHSKE